MIRVLHTIDTTGPGGAETVFVNLVMGLDSSRFESIVAIKGPGWVCDTLQDNGFKPVFIPAKGGFNFKYLQSLIKTITVNNIDIVQSHLFGSNVYCSLAGIICNLPVISTFHGFVDTNGSERLMPLKKSIINRGSRKIVFVSNRLREEYVRRYSLSAQRSVTIYNGIDTKKFCPDKKTSLRKRFGVSPEHILIGAIGNIRAAKGYEYFLQAAKIVHGINPKCRFLIAGDRDREGVLSEKLHNMHLELGLDNILFFLGFQADIAEILNNLDVFVLASTSEGLSIATLEALACGIPVVVTRCGGPEEILTDTPYSRIVEPQNEHELAEGMLRIIETINNDQSASDNRPLCREEFTSEKMIDNYSRMYEECVKVKRWD